MLSTYPADGGDTDKKKIVWIDLISPTEEETRRLTADYGLAIPPRHQLLEIESSSRLHMEKGVLYLNMPIATRDAGNSLEINPIGFILAKPFLVTVRYTALKAFDTVREELEKGDTAPAAADILTSLLGALVEFGADVLEEIANDLNGVSKRVFRRYGNRRHHNIARSNRALKETLIGVGEGGEHLSHIRDSLLCLERMVPFICDNCHDWIKDDTRTRLKTVAVDVKSLTDFESHLSNKVQFLLDAVLGFINTEQNDIFKVLTIVSVVGIPPTLIASMYGMNFQNIPEYHWQFGYAWGLSLIFLSVIIPVAWFKWRGWW